MTEDLHAVPIDRENLLSFMALSVSNAQLQFVARNAETIAQACFAEGTTLRGLIWKGEPAGLYTATNPKLAAADDPHSFQPDCIYLWRFMIDQRFQGHGLGQRALKLIFDTAVSDGFDGLTLTAVNDVPGCPVPFYQKQGFELTGRILDGESELVKRRAR